MPEATLRNLLERNARHVESLSDDHFAAVRHGQQPAAVSVSCADSRVSQEGMWDVSEAGWLFTPSTIGNQVWDRQGGGRVVDGSVLYPVAYAETEVAAVVGHTGCGAVTAALDAVEGGEFDAPPGVRKWIDLLAPVVADGLEDERVDPERDASLVDQLVEYNVDRQVAFLLASEAVPDDLTAYGFVYDFQGVYGDVDGRAYLVNADGETDTGALQSLAPDGFEDHVRRLL
ncbi:MAG: carbonic anhydrase [Halobacteriales archaeon]